MGGCWLVMATYLEFKSARVLYLLMATTVLQVRRHGDAPLRGRNGDIQRFSHLSCCLCTEMGDVDFVLTAMQM